MNKVFKGVIIGFVGVAIGVSLTIRGYLYIPTLSTRRLGL